MVEQLYTPVEWATIGTISGRIWRKEFVTRVRVANSFMRSPVCAKSDGRALRLWGGTAVSFVSHRFSLQISFNYVPCLSQTIEREDEFSLFNEETDKAGLKFCWAYAWCTDLSSIYSCTFQHELFFNYPKSLAIVYWTVPPRRDNRNGIATDQLLLSGASVVSHIHRLFDCFRRASKGLNINPSGRDLIDARRIISPFNEPKQLSSQFLVQVARYFIWRRECE